MRSTMKVSMCLMTALAVAVMTSGVKADDAPKKKAAGAAVLKQAKELFAPLPDKMPGAEHDTEAKIALGKELYFEKRISINNTQSCNDCHRVDEGLGGVDNQPTSTGAKGDLGGRNAPTSLNAGFHIAQFWDGRAPDLAAQAKGPVLAGVEMGMPDEASVLARLEEHGYAEAFKKAFPDADNPLTYDNFAEAVAAFERTLITHDRFDDLLKGDAKALSRREKAGLAAFIEVGCADCHSGPLLGGDGYEKMGAVAEYRNKKDLGRFEVTKKEEDKFVFKVPSLRNIEITGPYFHDGKCKMLPAAVRNMAALQLGEELEQQQVGAIVAFLKSLTDKERVPAEEASE